MKCSIAIYCTRGFCGVILFDPRDGNDQAPYGRGRRIAHEDAEGCDLRFRLDILTEEYARFHGVRVLLFVEDQVDVRVRLVENLAETVLLNEHHVDGALAQACCLSEVKVVKIDGSVDAQSSWRTVDPRKNVDRRGFKRAGQCAPDTALPLGRHGLILKGEISAGIAYVETAAVNVNLQFVEFPIERTIVDIEAEGVAY